MCGTLPDTFPIGYENVKISKNIRVGRIFNRFDRVFNRLRSRRKMSDRDRLRIRGITWFMLIRKRVRIGHALF